MGCKAQLTDTSTYPCPAGVEVMFVCELPRNTSFGNGVK
jgi:hypothetical protein